MSPGGKKSWSLTTIRSILTNEKYKGDALLQKSFTGDLTKEREAELLAAGINPQSTVLKAGHHGSDTSSSPEFLEAVRPKFGIFCAGADNSFGHPKPEIVKRFRQLGIKTYRTDEDGAVVFYTDGERMRVETYN